MEPRSLSAQDPVARGCRTPRNGRTHEWPQVAHCESPLRYSADPPDGKGTRGCAADPDRRGQAPQVRFCVTQRRNGTARRCCPRNGESYADWILESAADGRRSNRERWRQASWQEPVSSSRLLLLRGGRNNQRSVMFGKALIVSVTHRFDEVQVMMGGYRRATGAVCARFLQLDPDRGDAVLSEWDTRRACARSPKDWRPVKGSCAI